MFSLFYNFLLSLLFLAFLPKFLYQYFWKGKYRKSLMGRMGRGFDAIDTDGKRLIWIHAPSLGETKAISLLARKMKEQAPHAYLLITTTTETGHEEAKKSIPMADKHLFLPFDFSWIVRPIIRKLKPSLVILCESDFWYNFLDECKKQGTQVCLVNGKLSVKSLQRHLQCPCFAKMLFSKIDLFCLQSQRYLERFSQLGVPSEKLVVTGNIKFDNASSFLNESDVRNWKERLGIENGDLVLVAGSTHNPEETMLLDTLQALWQHFPATKLILVPRHPERFLEVANLIKAKQIAFSKFSEINQSTGKEKVILIDAIGILKTCYQLGDIAFVGGSFTEKVGGHNILEPCSYAKPVVYGPHMHSQLDLVDFMNEFHTGIQTRPEEFLPVLKDLLGSKEKRDALGESGLKLMNAMQGASEKTFSAICNNFIF